MLGELLDKHVNVRHARAERAISRSRAPSPLSRRVSRRAWVRISVQARAAKLASAEFRDALRKDPDTKKARLDRTAYPHAVAVG